MLGSHVAGRRTERKLGVEARGPAIVAAAALVAVRAAKDGQVVLGQVHPGVVPGVAVATIPRFHRNERGLRGVARGVLEEGTGRCRVVLASDKGREGRNATRLAQTLENRAALASLVSETVSGRRVRHKRDGSVLQQL